MAEAVELTEKPEPAEDERTAAEIDQRQQILDLLGMRLAKSRFDAVSKRHLSGIEWEWLEDEEHYQGIDDRNRHEMRAWHMKPSHASSLSDADGAVPRDAGSTVFINITRPYVDAASARVGDMLLPTDERGWSINPTPVPELIKLSRGDMPHHVERDMRKDIEQQQASLAGSAAVGPGPAVDPIAGGVEQANQDVVEEKFQAKKSQLVDEAKAQMSKAREGADFAQKQIEDWHIEGNYHSEVRAIIEDSSRIGTGVIKGPVPRVSKHIAYLDGKIIIEDREVPVSRRVDPWNCYPDPGCGENVHDGSHHWERDDISPRALHRLKLDESYITSAIDTVLEEGPTEVKKEVASEGGKDDLLGLAKRDTSNLFEIWYYYGQIEATEAEAAGIDLEDNENRFLDVSIEMVNNKVIKAAIHVMDTGEIPYDYMPWQRRNGTPFGLGVARQVRTPQRIINGAGRNLMDNAGLAGGPMWAVNSEVLTPIDGNWGISPRKGWQFAEGSDLQHAENAIFFIEMPMRTTELMAIIEMGMKFAEDVTGLPMILQGQQGASTHTLGGMEMLQNNASSVMRRTARIFDDKITEPHINRYYRYYLQFGEDDRGKGEFVVDAEGSERPGRATDPGGSAQHDGQHDSESDVRHRSQEVRDRVDEDEPSRACALRVR